MKTGLLLIDIQKDYFPGGAVELVGVQEASAKAAELLSFFRENQRPTFHIQHISASKKAGFFVPGTEGVKIHESVAPGPDDVIVEKRYPNSFRETDLLGKLTAAGIEELVICGAMSHMCVDATTRAAADLGFRCVVIHDACATRDLAFEGTIIPSAAVHGSFMAALAWGYARVLGLEEYLSLDHNA
jgi:nicotinamidase-related amidase